MTNVNFEVIKIEKAMKHGCVVVTLKFEGSNKEFTYVRKAYNNTTVLMVAEFTSMQTIR